MHETTSNDTNDTPENPSRRKFLGLIGAGTAVAALPPSANSATSFLEAIKQDRATKDTTLTREKTIAMIEALSKEGASPSHPITTPVEAKTLNARLSEGYTILSFQFGECKTMCPMMQHNFASLENKLKENKDSFKINHLVIDASAQNPAKLKNDMTEHANTPKERTFVFSPPQNNQQPATDMQHAVGFMTSELKNEDNGMITEMGHSPRIHIFAPDGTLLTKDHAIDATNMEKFLKETYTTIKTHAQGLAQQR